MTTKILTVTLTLFILLLAVEFVRREKLTFKYAVGWIIVSLIALVFAVWDHGLFQLAGFLGFELPSNFIFFSLITAFVFLSFLMTLFLCQNNSRNDAMARKIGILEYEIKQLKKGKSEK